MAEGRPRLTERKPYQMLRFGSTKPTLVNNDIVEGVLARESIAVMYGQSGSTKSFVAIEIGLAVASATPWRGHVVKQRGRVVYVAAEGGREMHNRLVAAHQNYELGPADAVDFWLVPSVVRLIEDSPDVDRFVRTVSELAGAEGAALVIIDTLSQSMAGGDENGPKDMSAAIAAFQRIRDELGAAVLIVHHSGRRFWSSFGHSSLRAATDTDLEVTQTADGLYRIRATKQKEGVTGAEWLHRLEQVEVGRDEDGEAVTSAIVRPIGGKP